MFRFRRSKIAKQSFLVSNSKTRAVSIVLPFSDHGFAPDVKPALKKNFHITLYVFLFNSGSILKKLNLQFDDFLPQSLRDQLGIKPASLVRRSITGNSFPFYEIHIYIHIK